MQCDYLSTTALSEMNEHQVAYKKELATGIIITIIKIIITPWL
jgi:hypothetical protein